MAEESRFSKHPRIAWGPPSRYGNVEHEVSESKPQLSYLPAELRDDCTSCIQPLKGKFPVRSSLFKLKLSPLSTYPPVASKNLYFSRQKSSKTLPLPPSSLSTTRIRLTNPPLQHTATRRHTPNEQAAIRLVRNLTIEKRSTVKNLAQVAPINTNNMDHNNKEKTLEV